MKTLVASAPLGIVVVATALVLIVVHEVLAAIDDGAGRFAGIQRWLTTVIAVVVVVLTALIIARFYYLRT